MIKKLDINLDDFKKWIEKESFNENIDQEKPDMMNENFIGKEVISSINYKKLKSKAEVYEGYTKEVCLDFFENGGTIIEVEEDTFLIEVESGQLYLNKSYVEEA